jgi:Holliday junction DNA helicase RuvB
MIDDNDSRIVAPNVNSEDIFELTLRPQALTEYIGQKQVKDNLNILLTAAKQRQEPPEHILLYGPPGLGKTTLAHIIAKELGVQIRVTSGPAIERSGDLAAILSNLQPGEILFIDEIHRLNRVVEEVLYPAMEDYALDLVIGKGPAARTVRIDLPKFTIIGATTRYHLLSSPLRDRFGATYRLDFYQPDDIEKIISRSANILNVEIDSMASQMLAQRSRLTPRIANRLLKRVRDYAQVKANGQINHYLAEEALKLMNVDSLGLDPIDRRILQTIIEMYKGGPVGVSTIAANLQEDESTVEEVYEPYLLQIGLLARTPRGRVATENAWKHLGLEVPVNYNLFS